MPVELRRHRLEVEMRLAWLLQGEGSRPPPPPTPTPTPTPTPPHASLVQALLNELEMILLLITADFKRKSSSGCHSVCSQMPQVKVGRCKRKSSSQSHGAISKLFKMNIPPNGTQFQGACVPATCSNEGSYTQKFIISRYEFK